MDIHLNSETAMGIHYRILVLDESEERAEDLEVSLLTPFTDSGVSLQKEPAFRHCKKSAYFFVQNVKQLQQLPGASGFNMIWMNLQFPDAPALAQQFCQENPFCHLILYGGHGGMEVLDCLRGRPVGYVKDVSSQDEVHREMSYLWSQSEVEGGTLRLVSRDAFYDIPLNSLLYCQIANRKTCFVMDSIPFPDSLDTRIPFVCQSLTKDFLTYEMGIQIDEAERRLSKHGFLRVHKSYLVNRRAVAGLSTQRDAWTVFLQGKVSKSIAIPVSERYRTFVRDALTERENGRFGG